ncbi:hypothetical protein IMG5_078660, partial [Ichthyophthirius multifiliis]
MGNQCGCVVDKNVENQTQIESEKHISDKKHIYIVQDQSEKSLGQNFEKREKRPAYTFKSQAVYDGEWKGNMRDGYGVQKWIDGAKYEGEWVNNKACGKGKFYHVDGDIFEGQWENDKANGYGIYYHTNGAKYQGEWKNDLQHGNGIETWNDGSIFEGTYEFGKNKGKEYINGLMGILYPLNQLYFYLDLIMMGYGIIIKQVDLYFFKKRIIIQYNQKKRELINGKMEDNIKENGLIIKCMEKVFILGKMEENMKVIIQMIKKMDMVSINGLMVDYMMENGKMENNMDKENIIQLMELLCLEYGKMVKELNGQMIIIKKKQQSKTNINILINIILV